MECYYCHKSSPGGTNYGDTAAVAICSVCFVGLCADHVQKQEEGPAVCERCARTRAKVPVSAREQMQPLIS
jgi:hypothetical protein